MNMTTTFSEKQVSNSQRSVLIEVQNLSKHFEGLKAVDDVNFKIKAGELIGIIGPNGAGKTTLFNLLTGFLKPTKGKLILDEKKNIAGLSPHKIAKLGITRTFQLVRPFKLLNALENTTVPHIPKSKLTRSSTLKNKATWSLITVDLAEKKNYPAFILPHGDLKRLDFARAMAVQPRMLLLDEPFAGLSVEEAFRVERVIREANEKGMTIVIVEHKLKILMRLVERVIVLHQGKLIGEGTPKEIANNDEVITAYLGTEAKDYE
ncbi:ABC transporter ATP-binding protein [Candidatus Heimdallarchaeota archaeon B3_Heim]|nr:MAG: ABC transporter ATP-binding protein [Candidatus Heimdallarchaeota archaeon B3_Heim]